MPKHNIVDTILAAYLFVGFAIGAVIGLAIAAVVLVIYCAAYAYFW